ncbi:MAG: hypothetical protein Q8P41_25395 [Pseudomonadota bacterium]|nr:hypothetical protein [Pseudomonadota bacterium]
MSAILTLALLACTSSSPGEKDSAAENPATGGHPYAPDQYEDTWDIDSLGCDDATLYWAFDGAIAADGTLSGEETWYWFFSDEGWDTDCADTFDLSAVEEPTPIESDACNSCDRDFTASYVLNEDKRTCPFDGYENLLDNDDVDRIDAEAYTLAVMLDTNPLGADPGEVTTWMYAQDDRDEAEWIDRGLSTGTMTPETADDYTGPGAIAWARQEGLCITIEEE